MEQDYCVKQIIDEHGNFNVTGLDEFVEEVKLSRCGISYVVVAIMGPQSSGKSTLLNHLFQTNFREMDPEGRRKQTTRGIWIANCVGIEPCTIALDLEGNDGRERGPDGTAFEKQIALFALAVSDIMLINMWCHDIGREHAGNKPLLRTIFQVMMRLFGPGHKATLVFVVRDRSNKMPYSELVAYLLDDVDKLWTEVPKPQEHTSTRLNDIFRVEVVSLPNYEMEEDIFKEQVAQLRQRFSNSISPGGLAACNRHHVVPAAGFSLSAQKFWEIIKDNRDLDLPSQKNDMVDEVNSRKEEYQEKHPETTEEEITVHLQSQEAEVLDKVLEPPKGNHIKGMGRAGQRDSSFSSNGRGSTSRSRPPTVDEQQLQEVWEHYEQRLKETQNLAKQQIEEVQQRGQQQIEAMQSQLAALYAHLGMTPPPPTPTPTPPPQFRQPSPPQQVSPSSDDSNNI